MGQSLPDMPDGPTFSLSLCQFRSPRCLPIAESKCADDVDIRPSGGSSRRSERQGGRTMKKIEAAILAILLGASTTVHASSESPTNGTSTDSTMPTSQSTIAPPPAPAGTCCGCQPDHARRFCLRRLIEWATYCPKERIGCCKSCNSCQYKGAEPVYLYMTEFCKEGSGIRPTFAPNCCHGCKGCCNGCTNTSSCGCK
jgi:hypothetical protein